jgi:hypothetical protein
MKKLLVSIVMVIFLLGAGGVSTERWKAHVDNGAGSGIWTFTKKTDGSLGIKGEWVYDDVSCPFNKGKVSISGTSFTFTVQGTATKASAPLGFQDSAFILDVKGEVRDGKGSGTWAISFSVPSWPMGLAGKWTAIKISGKGVMTELAD